MSRYPEIILAAALVAGPLVAHAAGGYGLGREATPDEVAAWDIDVRPDGAGLPQGAGSVEMGEELFDAQCAVCHGDFGEGAGRWPVLAGGQGTLASQNPVKTVGSYWPYLSTVWDYVHRAMPFGDAQSLSADETYAITAYILYLNDLVDYDFELSLDNFAEVRLPNEGNFFPDDRLAAEAAQVRAPCMTDCKPAPVEITARAQVIDVTPQDASARRAFETGEDEAAAAAPDPAPAPAPAADLDPALVAAGEQVFKKCRACHKVGEGASHGVGPHLNGVVGREAAAADGFDRYSASLAAAAGDGLVWTEETLATYLEKPAAMIRGTRMSFAGLRKAEDRAAVIAYLKSVP